MTLQDVLKVKCYFKKFRDAIEEVILCYLRLYLVKGKLTKFVIIIVQARHISLNSVN